MTEQQHTFTTRDGTELFYRYRPAKDGSNDKAIVLFHRGHEHSARMMHIADEAGLDEFAYFAWDARGHGESPGERGDSPSLAVSVADIQDFFDHIQTAWGIAPQNTAVIAQSVGAVLVSTWLHDYAPKIRCAVLASPAFKVKLYVPFARSGLKLMQKWRGNFFVQSYVKAHYLSHDPARIDSYNTDPLIARAISVRILLGLYDAGERVVADAAAITTPIQLLISGSDWVVHHRPQHDFYNRLGSRIKERHVLKGFYHDTLGEAGREQAFAHIRRFIRACFAGPYAQTDVTDAHIHSASTGPIVVAAHVDLVARDGASVFTVLAQECAAVVASFSHGGDALLRCSRLVGLAVATGVAALGLQQARHALALRCCKLAVLRTAQRRTQCAHQCATLALLLGNTGVCANHTRKPTREAAGLNRA